MKSAFHIADRIGMLYNGEFIAIGSPQEFERTGDERVRQFVEGLADGPIPLRVSKTDYLADLLGLEPAGPR
jgi:phospholipid/cholesterol/gamma-HCH transport system ATP-binding protein